MRGAFYSRGRQKAGSWSLIKLGQKYVTAPEIYRNGYISSQQRTSSTTSQRATSLLCRLTHASMSYICTCISRPHLQEDGVTVALCFVETRNSKHNHRFHFMLHKAGTSKSHTCTTTPCLEIFKAPCREPREGHPPGRRPKASPKLL